MGDQLTSLKDGQVAKLNLSELPLAGLASGILLYVSGQEQHKAETGQPHSNNRWLKILGEGSLLYGVLATTQNLYPVIGGGLLAYTWGKADSVLKKVYETVDIGISLVASAVGVLFGMGVSASAKTHDFKDLFNALESKQILTELNQFKPSQTQHLKGDRKKLSAYEKKIQSTIKALYEKLNDPIQESTESHRDRILKKYKALTDKKNPMSTADKNRLLKHTEAFFNQLRPLVDTLEKEFTAQHQANIKNVGKKQLAELAHLIKRSTHGHVKLARAMNPIFGAIILGTVAQAFISKPIKALFGRLFPRLNGVNINMPERTFLFDNAHQQVGRSDFSNPLYMPHYDVGSELNHHLVGGPAGHKFGWGT